MKRFFILALGFFFAFSSAYSAPNKMDRKGRKQGAWAKTYDNGNLMYEGEFKNDVPVGTFKRYYQDGKLKSVQEYHNDETSYIKIYDNDGKTLTSEGKFNDKKQKVGEWKFYSNGQLFMTETFVDGLREGVSYSFKNGVVVEECPYKKGKLNGVKKAYLVSGKLYSETTYLNDVMDGDYRLYEGNELPVEEGLFKNGKRAGEWVSYDENHKVIDRISYSSDGKPKNQKEILKKNSEELDKNEAVISSKKYVEPTELFEGSSVISK